MVYAWRHKESGELQRILTESIDYVEEILDRANGRDHRIGPSVPHKELASVRLEQGQIGIGGVQEVASRDDPRHVGVEVERQSVEIRTEHEVPEVCVRRCEVH